MAIAEAQKEQLKLASNANSAITEFLRGMLDATTQEKNSAQNETYVFQNNYKLESEETKNITLRTDGRYMGRKQVDGRITTVYAKTIRQCFTKLKQASQKQKKQIDSKFTLHQWLYEWYKTYKENFVSEDTAKKIIRVVKHVSNNIKDLPLTQLTTQTIQKYLNTIERSRKKEFISLYFKACLQKAEDLELIHKNPFNAVVKEQKLNHIREGYTLAEQKIILEAIKGTQIENLILIYLITGIRKNELMTINLDTDLDLKNKTLKIKSEKKRDKNKYRYIDLTNEAIELLQKSKSQLKTKTDYIYRQLKTILNEYNIKTGLHRLRHTFATNHFYLGTPIKLISSWLGHETIELTQNIYTHIDRSITKEDIIKLYNNLYYRI